MQVNSNEINIVKIPSLETTNEGEITLHETKNNIISKSEDDNLKSILVFGNDKCKVTF